MARRKRCHSSWRPGSGAQARRSSARNKSTLCGGPASPVTAAQVAHTQATTGTASGQVTKMWLSVAGVPWQGTSVLRAHQP